MAITDFINLQVRRSNTQTTQVSYQFRVESYDANVKDMTNYRIRVWLNCNFDRTRMSFGTQSGQPFGGASGNPNFTVNARYFDSVSGNPPRVSTTPYNGTNGQYNVCVLLRFTLGSLDADGEGYENFTLNFNHTNFKQFDLFSSGNSRDYEASYSLETIGTYQENSTFVLEYNDIDPADPDSSNWARVTEVTDNVGTIDPDTGQYPYGDVDVDNTKTDHTLFQMDFDTEIQANSPTSNFISKVDLDVDRLNSIKRAIYRYNVAVIPAGISVIRAVHYQFMDICQINANEVMDFARLDSGPLVGSEVTWNEYSSGNSWTSAGGDFTFITSFAPDDSNRTGGSNDYQDNFIRIDIGSLVNDWKNGTQDNNGIINKYNNEGTFNTNQFESISSDNGTAEERPFLVVSGFGTKLGGNPTSAWFSIL